MVFLPLQHEDTIKLHALHFFEHFKNTLGRIYKKALKGLAKAPTLKRIAARPFNFCHDGSRKIML